MTATQAREWMIRHWSADDDGTDLDFDTLVEAYLAIFDRMPAEDEDRLAVWSPKYYHR